MKEKFLSRGLGGNVRPALTYTDDETYILRILSVTFSSVSIIAAILTLYGFYVMQKRFRHVLIMNLITSCMFTASWCWIYLIVVLTQGNIQSSSVFCQISGFFQSLGTEASDIALLMIVIHRTIYVLYPPTSLGEGGLYLYRRTAFAIWIIIPTLLAVLAFMNPAGAYYAGATHCYLPVRPFWYRLALAWIPRYIIFLVVLIMNAWLYFYVRYKFKNLNNTYKSQRSVGRRSSKAREFSDSLANHFRRHTSPPTPPLVYNGLTSEMRSSSQGSLATHIEYPRATFRTATFQEWTAQASPGNIPYQESIAIPTSSEVETHTSGSFEAARFYHTPKSPLSSPASWISFISRFKSRQQSKHSIRSFLRQPRSGSSPITPSTPFSQIELLNAEGQDLLRHPALEARAKARNQLGSLFIYPLAYMCIWIVPFATHLAQYNDSYVLDPPFMLNVVAVVILSSQSFLYCCLFCWREKPWRHPVQHQKSFAQQWADLKDWIRGRRRLNKATNGFGRSAVAMATEAAIAYRRREVEMSEATLSGENRARRGERSWWDDPDEEDERI